METNGIQRLLNLMEQAELSGVVQVQPRDLPWVAYLAFEEGKLTTCEIYPLQGQTRWFSGESALHQLQKAGALLYELVPAELSPLHTSTGRVHVEPPKAFLATPAGPVQREEVISLQASWEMWCPVRTRFGDAALHSPEQLTRSQRRTLALCSGTYLGRDIARLGGREVAEQLLQNLQLFYSKQWIVFKDEGNPL